MMVLGIVLADVHSSVVLFGRSLLEIEILMSGGIQRNLNAKRISLGNVFCTDKLLYDFNLSMTKLETSTVAMRYHEQFKGLKRKKIY